MHTRTSIIAGAAMGAVIALGAGASAQAKTAAHHHAKPAAGPTAEQMEIQYLKQSVAELTARLNASDAAASAAKSAAQSAQQTAMAAQDTAQATQTRTDAVIKTIPTQVNTAVAAIPKPKVGWWGDTSISGRMYGDISNINQKTDGVAVAGNPNGTNFDVKRFYISVDHKFNDIYSADFTTDFNYDSGPAGATQLYIKKAYLQAKYSDALVVRLGAADLPWVPFVEDIYGNRYIENVMIDRDKFGTSADWGAHVSGKLPAGMITFNYAISAINGMGYKKPGFIAGVNRSNDMDVEGRLSATAKDFTVAVGGYSGKLGNAVQGTTTYHSAERFDALVAYTGKRIRLGGEYFYASDWSDVKQANPLLTNSSEGLSVFGKVMFTPEFSAFGRYDWVKPKKTTTPALVDNYFNVGLTYSPAKIVDLSLVYKRDKVDNGTISTQNGTIGGVHSGTYDEIGLFTQFRW